MSKARIGAAGAAFAAVALCAIATDLKAQEKCADSPVEVVADSPDARQLICLGAGDAIRMLQRCEVYLRRPLSIHMVDVVRHPLGGVVVGLFDPRGERVLITAFRKIPDLVSGTPFDALPTRDFFRSTVVHEIIHAIMHQNFQRRPTNQSTYEYPAYALQIASLPPNVRARFLQTVAERGAIDTFTFNDIVLSFDPFLFAARAYKHFSASANGCAHLTALLEGKVEFIAELP